MSTKQTDIDYDNSEAAGSGGIGSLLDNMRHLRQAIAALAGGSWHNALTNRKAAVLADGTNINNTFKVPTTTISALQLNATGGSQLLGTVNINTLGPATTTLGNNVTVGLGHGPSLTAINGRLSMSSGAGSIGGMLTGSISVSTTLTANQVFQFAYSLTGVALGDFVLVGIPVAPAQPLAAFAVCQTAPYVQLVIHNGSTGQTLTSFQFNILVLKA